jgi:hypothetical protein
MITLTSSNPSRSPTIGTFFPILSHKCRTIDAFASFLIYDLTALLFDLQDGIGIVATYGAYRIRWKAFIGEFWSHDFYSLLSTKSKIRKGLDQGWPILVTGLASGIEGRYRTHSPRPGLLPLY